MKVFRLKPDFSYLSFYTWATQAGANDLYRSGMMSIGGGQRLPTWDALALYPDEPGLRRGNFMYLWSQNFAIDDHALAVLKPVLENCCEFLPLAPFEGQIFYLINALQCVDCLDNEQTEMAQAFRDKITGQDLPSKRIERYVFDPKKLPLSALFRIPEDRTRAELTVSGLTSPYAEFKSIVEREGLTGIQFEELWSTNGPPIRTRERFKKTLGL
jgi:hypothetical protein